MVETLEYDDDMLIENRFGFVSELTTRGTTPLDRTWIQDVDRVESVVSCHGCFEFEDEWDIGCVHLFG